VKVIVNDKLIRTLKGAVVVYFKAALRRLYERTE